MKYRRQRLGRLSCPPGASSAPYWQDPAWSPPWAERPRARAPASRSGEGASRMTRTPHSQFSSAAAGRCSRLREDETQPVLRNGCGMCAEMKTVTFLPYFILTLTLEMSSSSCILPVETLKLRAFVSLPKGHTASG